jgi:hypothetical protein
MNKKDLIFFQYSSQFIFVIDSRVMLTPESQFEFFTLVPDRRCRILKVVLVRRWVTWVLGIWRGEGLGKGLRKGRSVYKQPETEVDGSCHSQEGSK